MMLYIIIYTLNETKNLLKEFPMKDILKRKDGVIKASVHFCICFIRKRIRD